MWNLFIALNAWKDGLKGLYAAWLFSTVTDCHNLIERVLILNHGYFDNYLDDPNMHPLDKRVLKGHPTQCPLVFQLNDAFLDPLCIFLPSKPYLPRDTGEVG